jgi:hypothetical protein
LGWAATSTFGLLRAEATRKTRSTPLCHVQTTQTSHTQKTHCLPVFGSISSSQFGGRVPSSPHVPLSRSCRYDALSRCAITANQEELCRERRLFLQDRCQTLCAFTSCAHPEGVDSRCTAGETDDCACLPLCAALWGLSAHARAWCGGDGWGVDKTMNHACVGVADPLVRG